MGRYEKTLLWEEKKEEEKKEPLWPNLLNILGQLIWLGGLVEAMHHNWVEAFLMALVGTLIQMIPGFVIGLRLEKREERERIALFLILFLLALLPLLFVHLIGLYFIILFLVCLFSPVFNLNKRMFDIYFFHIVTQLVLVVLLANVLYLWTLTFVVDDPVKDIYFEPEAPLAGENFTVVVVVQEEGNWTLELEFRLDEGELNHTWLEQNTTISYSTQFQGLPEGTTFHYRVRIWEDEKEREVTNWRMLEIK
jgi:hypothetical protein